MVVLGLKHTAKVTAITKASYSSNYFWKKLHDSWQLYRLTARLTQRFIQEFKNTFDVLFSLSVDYK